MLTCAKRWLNKFVGIQSPKTKTLMDEVDLIKAISRVNDIAWNLNHYYGSFFSDAKIQDKTNAFRGVAIGGHRWVRALPINKRLVIYVIDDDIDSSAYGIMIDEIPAVFIQSDCYPKPKNTWIINAAVVAQDLTNSQPLTLPLNNIQDFFNLPEYLQRVMNDVLEKILIMDKELLDQKKSSMENLTNYS